MVHAVSISAVLNTFVLISVNKQTPCVADHHLCFRITFCVQYWLHIEYNLFISILSSVFHITLCVQYYPLFGTSVFHITPSIYALQRNDLKWRDLRILKASLLIKWSKYLENFCLWWGSENSKCPFPCSAVSLSHRLLFSCRMLGGVAGRHMSSRRRGSSPLVRLGVPGEQLDSWSAMPPLQPPCSPRYRRRRAVTTSDFKSCALVQTRVKLGDIMWVSKLVLVLSPHFKRVKIA
jgi:hypothetical protein